MFVYWLGSFILILLAVLAVGGGVRERRRGDPCEERDPAIIRPRSRLTYFFVKNISRRSKK
jgi:hypothetical protein